MRVISEDTILEGYQALVRNGEVVWVGRLGMPIEDVDFDTLIVHEKDYARILAKTMEAKPPNQKGGFSTE